MTAWMQEVLARYGQPAMLETAEGARGIQVFLRPAPARQEQAAGTMTEIGWADRRLWLYLGQERIEPGDTVRWNDMALQVRSSRPYYIGQTLSHWWAMLEQKWEAVE